MQQKPYQIFIGCPYRKQIRKQYDRLKKEIESETPLSLVLADTGQMSSAQYLLPHISEKIQESIACIFEVAGGNPNVSLEVGIAHALPVDYLITVNTRKPRTKVEKDAEKVAKEEGEIQPIIADLQGKVRIEYKAFDSLKKQVLSRYLHGLPFVQRWDKFRRENSGLVPHALKVFAEIRSHGRTSSSRVNSVLEGTGILRRDLTKALSKEKLLVVRKGPGGGYYYPAK